MRRAQEDRRGGGAEIWTLLAVTVATLVAMSLLTWGKLLRPASLVSMGFQFPELGLCSIAIALSMISGGIDLSIVSVANLSGILAAFVLREATSAPAGWTGPIALAAVLAGLLAGALCGAANGLLVARVGITPILATLGTMQLFMGLAFAMTGGAAVHGYPDEFLWLGNATVFGVPVPALLFAGIAAGAAILLGRTRFGTRLYLIGTNERAALFAGIDVKATLFRTYVATGILAAATGLLMISRANSAKADYGTSYLLQAVLVAILGGVSPSGGSGSIGGLILAVLSLQCLSSGFNLLRWNPYAKEFTWGALLLILMVAGAIVRARRRR